MENNEVKEVRNIINNRIKYVLQSNKMLFNGYFFYTLGNLAREIIRVYSFQVELSFATFKIP